MEQLYTKAHISKRKILKDWLRRQDSLKTCILSEYFLDVMGI